MVRRIYDAISSVFPILERASGGRLVMVQRRLLHTHVEAMILKRFIKTFGVDCIFDVGANVGQYASMLRTRVGYKGPIVSFEPIPECAETLRSKSTNDLLWDVEQVALSIEKGSTTFNVMAESQFSSLQFPERVEDDQIANMNKVIKQIPVQLGTIHDYFDFYKRKYDFKRPYLKMDTQGNDLLVASGAGDHLVDFCGIQSELAVVNIYKDSPNFLESIKFYDERGFKITAFISNNPGHFPRLVETDCILYNERFISAK